MARRKKERKSDEELMMEQIRDLTPKAVESLKAMLDDDKVAPQTKVRVIEIVLDRTFGKAEAQVKVTNVQESVAAAQAELEEIFAGLPGIAPGKGGNGKGGNMGGAAP